MNLKKQTLAVSEVASNYNEITSVDNDIIVPDVKPDVLKILQTSHKIIITQCNIQKDRVYVQGIIRLCILYIPDGDVIGNIKSMNLSMDFSHVIPAEGIRPEMRAFAQAEIDSLDCSLINSRKINVRGEIEINVRIICGTTINVPVEIEDADVNSKRETLKISNSVDCDEREIHFSETLEVPAGKPYIGEILRIDGIIIPRDQRFADGKVVLKADLKISTLYEADEENLSLQLMEQEIPLTEALSFPELTDKMNIDADYALKEISYEVIADDNGNTCLVKVWGTVSAFIKGTEEIELEALTDLYSMNENLEVKQEKCCIEQLCTTGDAHHASKEAIIIPDYLPEIMQVCDLNAYPKITSVSISDGSVSVKGYLASNLLYLSTDSSIPVSGFNHNTDFLIEIPVADACPDMVCDAKAELDHLAYNITSGRGLELRYIIVISVKLCRKERLSFIDSVTLSEEPLSPMPPMIIYFSEDNELVWDIAKKYRTTPEKIMDTNHLDCDTLKQGQRICIFR